MSDTQRLVARGLLLAVLVTVPVALLWALRVRQIEWNSKAISGTNLRAVDRRAIFSGRFDVLSFDQTGQSLWIVEGVRIQQLNLQTKQVRRISPQYFGSPLSNYKSTNNQTITIPEIDRLNSYIKMFDVKSGRLIRSLRVGDSMQVQRHIALSENNILATLNVNESSTGYDQQIKIWNAETGELLQNYPIQEVNSAIPINMSCLTISRDGTLVAAGTFGGDIFVCDSHSANGLRRWKDGSLENGTGTTWSGFGVALVVFSPDGNMMATASTNGTVRIWEPRSGKLLRKINTPSGGDSPVLEFSPDGKLLATAGRDTNGRIWDVQTGQLNATLVGHPADITAYAFSPVGDQLASGDEEGNIKLWRLDAPPHS